MDVYHRAGGYESYSSKYMGVFTIWAVYIKSVIYLYGIRFAYNLFGRVFLSTTITSLVLIIFMMVNHFKLIFRGEPFYPSDFTQVGHMDSVIPMVMDYFSFGICS